MRCKREFELLKFCARVETGQHESARIVEQATSEINWHDLLRLASFHKTLPLLYWNLAKLCPEAVPEEILLELEGFFQKNGTRNFIMADMLDEILCLFQEYDIEAVPFKGPVLAEAIFGNIAFRTFSDLDILIDHRDGFRAVQLLASHGFQPEIDLSHRQFRKFAQTENQLPLVHSDKGIIVELQWNLLWGYLPYRLDLHRLRGQLVPFSLGEMKVFTFGSEDLLVYLCIHGNHHCWEQLDHICCIAETLRACPSMDWEKVAITAKKLRCTRMLQVGLQLAKKILGAKVPEVVLAGENPDVAKAMELAAKIEENIFSASHVKLPRQISSRFSWWQLASQDSPEEVIRFTCWLILSPSKLDWLYLPIPGFLSFLHYPFRPIRLFFKFIMFMLYKLWPKPETKHQ